jgi:hypothetical protein
MMVHSFSQKDSSFSDFVAFSQAMGIPVTKRDTISDPRRIMLNESGSEIALYLGWTKDKVSL